MLTFVEAIAKEEGFGIPGARATRCCNPGNLNMEPWLEGFGATLETIPAGVEEEPRFACFPTSEAGWSAMTTLLTKDYLGLTVSEALNKWAPASDGNAPSSYVAAVCSMTGLTADTVLTPELLA
jgi:hypothetical protein